MPPGIPKFPTISLSEKDLQRNFAVRSWVHIVQIFAGKKCFIVVVVNPRDWHWYVIAIVILLYLKNENCSKYSSYRCVFWGSHTTFASYPTTAIVWFSNRRTRAGSRSTESKNFQNTSPYLWEHEQNFVIFTFPKTK